MEEFRLDGVVAEYLKAVNSFDVDGIMATFASDAIVNDARREIVGAAAIWRWVEKEIVGDHVTIEPISSVEHYGDIIVHGRFDGDYDKTGLPDELVLSSYFGIRGGEIVSLVVINNRPSEYASD